MVKVLGYGAMFGAFTYIAYTLTKVSGFPTTAVPWLLILVGIGLFIGNTAGGKAADRSVDSTLIVVLAGLTLVLVFFGLTAHNPVASIASLLLMGGFGFGNIPGLQTRVMAYASDSPTLASGANIAAFNLGNALGGWLGALTISAGLGYTSPIWSGAAITALALLVMLYAAGAARTARRTRGHPPPVRQHSGRLSQPAVPVSQAIWAACEPSVSPPASRTMLATRSRGAAEQVCQTASAGSDLPRTSQRETMGARWGSSTCRAQGPFAIAVGDRFANKSSRVNLPALKDGVSGVVSSCHAALTLRSGVPVDSGCG